MQICIQFFFHGLGGGDIPRLWVITYQTVQQYSGSTPSLLLYLRFNRQNCIFVHFILRLNRTDFGLLFLLPNLNYHVNLAGFKTMFEKFFSNGLLYFVHNW